MMKYNKEQVKVMKKKLALVEYECFMKQPKESACDLFLFGCVGWNNMEDYEVVEEYESVFGKFDG